MNPMNQNDAPAYAALIDDIVGRGAPDSAWRRVYVIAMAEALREVAVIEAEAERFCAGLADTAATSGIFANDDTACAIG